MHAKRTDRLKKESTAAKVCLLFFDEVSLHVNAGFRR